MINFVNNLIETASITCQTSLNSVIIKDMRNYGNICKKINQTTDYEIDCEIDGHVTLICISR